MPIKIDKTIRTSGVITNSRAGFVRLSRKIGESDTFKSMSLSKFVDGTLVELIFRVSTNTTPPSRQLVRATELNIHDRYWLAMTQIEEGAFRDELHSVIVELLGFSHEGEVEFERVLAELPVGDLEPPIKLIEGLEYDVAWNFAERLAEYFNGSASFEVLKHTTEDMPEGVPETAALFAESLEWVGGHWVAPKLRLLFVVARQVIHTGRQINMMLRGESGYGKTSTFQAIGDWLNIPVIHINCGSLQDTEQWFGYPEARDGSTVFEETEFTRAITAGNCVVILDEFNRVEPWIHNSLMPILDHRRRTEIHGHEITVGPGVIFGMTINDGVRYAGTHTIDLAVINRGDVFADVEAPPPKVETDIVMRAYGNQPRPEIERVVSMMNELRKSQGEYGMPVDISTRSTLKIANLMDLGLSARQASQFVIIFAADVADRKGLIDIVNMKLGIDKIFQ